MEKLKVDMAKKKQKENKFEVPETESSITTDGKSQKNIKYATEKYLSTVTKNLTKNQECKIEKQKALIKNNCTKNTRNTKNKLCKLEKKIIKAGRKMGTKYKIVEIEKKHYKSQKLS